MMSVVLRCDAPGCDKEVCAIPKKAAVSYPDGWWLQVGSDGKIAVGCCTEHFVQATSGLVMAEPRGKKTQPSDGSPSSLEAAS